MANRIFYNPAGYIEAVIEGDQTYMSFTNLKPDAEMINDELQRKGERRLALIDVTKQGKFSPDSNRAAMEILESMNYEKAAIFGTNKVISEVAKAIILAMGKTNNTKVFSDRESAVAWLMEVSDS